MPTREHDYFDYFDEYGNQLEELLGIEDLVEEVLHRRGDYLERPRDALVGCRTHAELALKKLMGVDDDDKGYRFELMIEDAHRDGVIDSTTRSRLNIIRNSGNDGAHERVVTSADAEDVLRAFDAVLRKIVVTKLGGTAYEADMYSSNKPPYLAAEDSLLQEAETADALSGGTTSLEQSVHESDAALEDNTTKALDLVERYWIAHEGLQNGDTSEGEYDAICQELDEQYGELLQARTTMLADRARIKARTEEILKEADAIRLLLSGDGGATDEQMRVLSFPKRSDAKTNALLIRGGAGTGKTLCQLARLIHTVRGGEQLSLDEMQEPRRALFVCFNKPCASYVQGILRGVPELAEGIDVESIDLFLNQLVRARPRRGYEHLSRFAADARYPSGWQLIYEVRELVEHAMEVVASRHPEVSPDAYYLDSSTLGNLAWMEDEIAWLEQRYESPSMAHEAYLSAERVGRGGNRRPNAQVRQIILEVWEEFNRLLTEDRRYTISQAEWRLMRSNLLPRYDAIAIDEAQDLSLLTARLFMRMRRDERSMVFVAGDEDQKIYKRDFSWRELGDEVHGHTIALTKNLRNPPEIAAFADRLHGGDATPEDVAEHVIVSPVDPEDIMQLVCELAARGDESTMVVGSDLRGASSAFGVSALREALTGTGVTIDDGENYADPGVRLVTERKVKGLECDNVVVIYAKEADFDYDTEKNIRYVDFTRARKRLYVCYPTGRVPRLLQDYYADFV